MSSLIDDNLHVFLKGYFTPTDGAPCEHQALKALGWFLQPEHSVSQSSVTPESDLTRTARKIGENALRAPGKSQLQSPSTRVTTQPIAFTVCNLIHIYLKYFKVSTLYPLNQHSHIGIIIYLTICSCSSLLCASAQLPLREQSHPSPPGSHRAQNSWWTWTRDLKEEHEADNRAGELGLTRSSV